MVVVGMSITHTQDEIVARIHALAESRRDFFGAETSRLVSALDLDHAKEFLKPEYWASWEQSTEAELREAAREYLSFAMDKAGNHRGLSAGRSVSHYSGLVWLLEPDQYDRFEAAPYEQYGVPQLRAAADILGLNAEWFAHVDEPLTNMANGVPCREGCDEGCGR